MTLCQFAKNIGAGAAFTALVIGGMLISSPRGQAENDDFKIQQGFAIAPVPLNLAGKDRNLVGLGSYIVNAQAVCNDCHTKDPSTQYIPTGNPYLLSPPFNKGKTQVNPATYLGGGNNFGNLGAGSDIVTRNLTPDRTGRPEGGHTFSDFLRIMRTGVDFDRLHPRTCSATVTTNCVPFPFNGAVLQIMPWPTFQNMSDHDIHAIYEYLSAIPCIDTIVAGQPQLRNVCH